MVQAFNNGRNGGLKLVVEITKPFTYVTVELNFRIQIFTIAKIKSHMTVCISTEYKLNMSYNNVYNYSKGKDKNKSFFHLCIEIYFNN